jgi:dolichol-phosphate mannosyltransferase
VALELSVVVPVFRCTDCLRELHHRLTATLDALHHDYEIILVDDDGEDAPWEVIADLATVDSNVLGVALSRNFGQHAAIAAGLSRARGRWIVVMDCDLQEPPETIRALYSKALEGYDIVYTVRDRASVPWVRGALSSAYYRVLNVLSGTSFAGYHGTLSMMSRKVLDLYLRLPERERDHFLILNWLGFKAAEVEYVQVARRSGKSSYTFRSLVRQAVAAVLFQTTTFLRWVVYLGFVIALVGVGFAVYLVAANLSGSTTPGWTSLAVFTLTIGGTIILTNGIIGLYVGRVFDEVKARPLFVIDRTTDEEFADQVRT